jgi:TRAP-type mannitol/chloroaromatic compound transport system permease small subunit
MTKLSIISIVWLQMAYALRQRQHLRTNLLLGALPRLGQHTILILNASTGIVIFFLIAYYAYPEFVRAWRTGAFEGEHPVRIPVWPIWGTVMIGSTLTAVEYAIQAGQTLFGQGEDAEFNASTSSAPRLSDI